MKISRLTIIGVGLIGGSLARALRRNGICEHIVGCGRRVSELERAVELGVIDSFETDPVRAVSGADMVFVSIPLGACRSIFGQIAGFLQEDAIVTDAGSVKGSVVADAREALGEHFPWFVPGHPIAGTEKSGVAASFAELFDGHRVILTPLSETRPEAVERVSEMWRQAGAEIDVMSVEHHDEVLAATSHLPHILAYSLVTSLSNMEESCDVFRFAAGGFADFTRIASSSPTMWHDVVFANRDAILLMLERFDGDLGVLIDAVRNNDNDRVMEIFSQSKSARDRFAASRAARLAKNGLNKDAGQ